VEFGRNNRSTNETKRQWVNRADAVYNYNYMLDTALLQWISEYAVRAYTTTDSAVLYLNHARIA